MVYTDEDKVTTDLKEHFQPHLKPDFNLDLLRSNNYICHFFTVRREIVEQVGGFRKEFDGAADYDFISGAQKKRGNPSHTGNSYHWRTHKESTADNPASKMYAFEAGKRAVEAHYERIGVKAQVQQGEFLGLYRSRFIRERDPLISVVIPNKDHIDDLKRCIDSIEQKSTYKNLEYIIVENNSTEKETFAYYKKVGRN